DNQKGNAAVKYFCADALKLRNPPGDTWEVWDKLRSAPLAEMDEKAAQDLLAPYLPSLRFLHAGARMESVDWETDFRQEGFSAVLPSLGQLRNLSNLLAIEIRLDIKNRRWVAAQDKLQTGFAFARHMGEGETLIQSLVGIAIASTMNKCVEDWVAQPEAPNLYWPLTSLPRPFNDLRRPMAFERATAILSFPELRQMREGQFSVAQWISFVKRFKDLAHGMGNDDGMGQIRKDQAPYKWQLAGLGLAVLEYPRAKAFLIERGVKPQAVAEMPVAEVLGRYYLRSYDESADDFFKWVALSYREGQMEWERAENRLLANPNTMNLLARIFLPSLGRARTSAVRLDRQIAMLRIIEALRAYAADHGALPETLGELTLPVPQDPIHEQPFEYQRTGDKASLISPATKQDGPRGGYRYDITLRKP
ncbi:MAG: hypothetical protein WCI73_16710, partial [Phycisphaerae bacterium]